MRAEGNAYSHLAPEMRVHYGEECLKRLPAELARAGKSRAVVVCGRTLARHPKGLPRIAELLGENFAGSFEEVTPHSPVDVVQRAAARLADCKADAVVALGGGSAIVTARSASILLAEDRPIEELSTSFAPGQAPRSPRLLASKLPQFVVPTTPTTACSKAGAAVQVPGRGRLTMFDPQTRAKALFIEPRLASETPREVFLDAALNSFATAVQGLESARRDPIADGQLIQALRLLRDSLPLVTAGQDSALARGQAIAAAVLVGRGSDHTGGGLVAVLGHSLGARSHRPNGRINAVLLPHVMRLNAPAVGDRLAPLVEVFQASGEPASSAADLCERFLRRLGVQSSLRELGIEPGIFAHVAEDARSDWFFYQVPRKLDDPAELISLLERAA